MSSNQDMTTSYRLLQNQSSTLLSTIGVGVLAYILYKVIAIYFHYRWLVSYFEGVHGPEEIHWLFGSLHLYGKDPQGRVDTHKEWCRKYPRFYRFFLGRLQPILVVHHPETVKAILKTSEPKPTGYTGGYRFMLPWLGEGLLIAEGKRWARSRRLLTPAFHFDILKPYIKVYNECAEQLMKNIESFSKTGEKFEVFGLISLCTLDIILKCAFSYDTGCQTSRETHPYVQAVNEIATSVLYRLGRPYLYPDFIFYLTNKGRQFRHDVKYVHKVADDVVSRRRKTLEEKRSTGRKYLDFVDILLTAKDDNDVGLTAEEIRNEVNTFLFEGHDTTASSISWILFSLAKEPEYQRKCQMEIDFVLSGKDSEEIEWSDLQKLEYLGMCIKEGMRLHHPVPYIGREFTKESVLDGRVFPKGTNVVVSILGLHHNEEIWEKPEVFDPERFSKENVAKMDSYQFAPFSAGPRNCIGQHFAMNEEKVVLARLLRRFSFELDKTHDVRKRTAAVTRADTGIMMFARRK